MDFSLPPKSKFNPLRIPEWVATGLLVFFGLLGSGCQMASKTVDKPETLSNSQKRSMQRKEEDDWAFVGKEARTRRPSEKENDWIDGLVKDKKTLSIERNLGID